MTRPTQIDLPGLTQQPSTQSIEVGSEELKLTVERLARERRPILRMEVNGARYRLTVAPATEDTSE